MGEIRGLDASFPVLVGGDPAEVVDFRASLAERLPIGLAVVVVATFGLLFLMTGSLVVPLKAIVMNVLSLGATFGALVWIFQDGHLAGALGVRSTVVRTLLVPATMKLMGRWNWWSPRPLARFHDRVALHEAA